MSQQSDYYNIPTIRTTGQSVTSSPITVESQQYYPQVGYQQYYPPPPVIPIPYSPAHYGSYQPVSPYPQGMVYQQQFPPAQFPPSPFPPSAPMSPYMPGYFVPMQQYPPHRHVYYPPPRHHHHDDNDSWF